MSSLVAFDLDGTLIDSQQDLAESANEMLETYLAPPLAVDAIASMVGDGVLQLVRRVRSATGVTVELEEMLGRFLSVYDRRLLVHTRLYSGVSDALEMLADRGSLAVLTNKPEGLSRRILDALGVSARFAWVIGGDSGFPRKPDPAGLRHLMATAGATPVTTVYVGDSMIDVETARRAGVGVVVASYGFGRLREPIVVREAEMVAETPWDLPRMCESLLQSGQSPA